MDRKVGATQSQKQVLYDDFEPLCYWRREDGQDTLIVHLPEFKKEQLKIKISNTGLLKITGERPVDATKWNRFLKEVNVTKDYNANNIHAKFAQGRLHVTFPKKIPSLSSSPSQKPSSTQQSPLDHNKRQEIGKDQVPDQKNIANSTEKSNGDNSIRSSSNGKSVAQTEKLNEDNSLSGNGKNAGAPTANDRVLRLKRFPKVVVGVGVAIVAAFSVYVMYKYWSSMYINVGEDLSIQI